VLGAWQKVNHFPMSLEITRKDLLARNISNMAAKHGKAFDFIPKSYLLPGELALLMHDYEK
jgi:Tubulin-tyrosine ligase family